MTDSLSNRKARLIHVVYAFGSVLVLKPQRRDRIELCLHSLHTHNLVPCIINLASPYALDFGMSCAEVIKPALADGSGVRWWQPCDLVAVSADFLGCCYGQGWRSRETGTCKMRNPSYQSLLFGVRKNRHMFDRSAAPTNLASAI
jgi:hypothetical protein